MALHDDYVETARKLYNEAEGVWPKDDKWHQYTRETIEGKLYQWVSPNMSDTILNAGSGGTEYKLNGVVFHLDVADEKIKHLPNSVVASIEEIPFEDEKFDYIICVGSVLNYVPLFPSITELVRVLKPGGKLLLEFERSNSAGLWFSQNYAKPCVFKKYQYNNQEHGLWLYSENFINNILEYMNMKLVKSYRFHILGSIYARISQNVNHIVNLSQLDNAFQVLGRPCAHNYICLYEKLKN